MPKKATLRNVLNFKSGRHEIFVRRRIRAHMRIYTFRNNDFERSRAFGSSMEKRRYNIPSLPTPVCARTVQSLPTPYEAIIIVKRFIADDTLITAMQKQTIRLIDDIYSNYLVTF